MPVDRLPGGTRGARTPPKRLLAVLMPIMEWFHRRSGDRFRGSDLLYLTTVGARTGERRTNPVARTTWTRRTAGCRYCASSRWGREWSERGVG
jgi:F420H(2)-dependent quinone reductase